MKNLFTRVRIWVFVILFGFFFIMVYFDTFANVRDSISDNLYNGNDVLENIVIIEINDQSIQEIGRWPWNRDIYGKIIDRLGEAKAIGIDLSFFESSENDLLLKKAIENDDRIVLAGEFNNGIIYEPIFDSKVGIVNVITDGDGVTRSVDFSVGDNVHGGFAFEIYNKVFEDDDITDDKYNGERLIINFAEPNSFEKVGVSDVLNGGDNIGDNSEDLFEDKIVLIGVTAPDLHDLYFVPTSNGVPMAGVEVHANILQNFILDNFLKKQNKLFVFILVFIFGFIGLFIISRLNIYYSIGFVILFLFVYGIISVIIFNKFDYIVDVFFVPLSLIVFSGVGQGVNYFEEKRQKEYLINAFGKYISKDLLDEIIEHKNELKLGGDKREISIFFSDIRGFTSISEKLSAEKLVSLMNDYLTEMTNIILKHNGTVDKFIGDAIMAFWNAPLLEENHSELACKCAIEQIKLLEKLRGKWHDEGFPKIDIGIGIHSGEAIIGNMGSDDRFDYTAMGDSINLGSRLEGLTKQYGVSIIVSSSVYDKVKDKFRFRKLDAVKVKGKKIPVVIYELIGNIDEEKMSNNNNIINNNIFVKEYEKSLDLYFNRDFERALKGFEKAMDLEKNKKDIACELFISRCKEYIEKEPRDDWDGAFEMISK